MSTGIGVYTSILTTGILIGLLISIFNRKIGWTIIFVGTIGWLLRYFEHVSYLLIYDIKSQGRWFLISIPIILCISIFVLIYKARQESIGKPVSIKFISITFLILISTGLISFLRKPQTHQFNCWYYIEDNKDDFTITFSVTPKHIFEATANSSELMNIIKKEALTYEFIQGYYCPETKVKVITRLNEVVGIEIMGFRNSEINKVVNFEKPFELDIRTLKGDKTILQPDFNLGD